LIPYFLRSSERSAGNSSSSSSASPDFEESTPYTSTDLVEDFVAFSSTTGSSG